MTTEVLAQSLQAGVQATFGQGRIWYLKTATGPVSIVCETLGTNAKIRKFLNVGAGFKFSADPDDGWTYLRLTSASSQNIEIIIGDDDVEVSNAVTVNGAVTTTQSPLAALSASAPDSAIVTATALAIAANLSRRSIIIGALSTNTASVRVQSTAAGANKGMELQPGTWETFPTTSALDVRNDSGATQSVWTMEFS